MNEKGKKDSLVRSNIQEHEKEIEAGDCYVGTCCFGSYPMNPDDEMLPGVSDMGQLNVEEMITEISPDISRWVFNANSSVEKIIIMEGIQRTRVEEVFQKLYQKVKSQSHVAVTVVFNEEGVSLASIGSAYKMLKVELYRNVILGKSQLCVYDKKEVRELKEWNIDLQDLRKKIIDTDLEQANQKLKECLSRCEDADISQKKLVKYLNIIMGYYYERYPKTQIRELEIESILANARNYKELFDEIIHFLNILCTIETAPQVAHPLALKVKEYLDTHYQQAVTNTTLAESFGFVATYLSRVFKTQYGITPSAYLVQIRIEHAKKILREQPGCLIKEVAEAVGYSDQYYFSKVFHKETSVWPTEFKVLS